MVRSSEWLHKQVLSAMFPLQHWALCDATVPLLRRDGGCNAII